MNLKIKTTSEFLTQRLTSLTICLFVLFLWSACMTTVWRFLGDCQIKIFRPPSPRFQFLTKLKETNTSSFKVSVSEMGISEEEWNKLQKVLDWPSSLQEITQLDLSTSPHYTTFSIIGINETHKVGENIRIIITARDHNNNLKSYGGDYFLAQLFDNDLKASVYGDVVDHRNGTYTVDLLLPWEGKAQVYVRLIHPSEAVKVLKKYWTSSFTRVHYNGEFEGPGPNGRTINEKVECNIKWGLDRSWIKRNCCCEYKDLKTGTVWLCEKPKQLSCERRMYHEFAAFENPLTPFEDQLFTSNLRAVDINGDNRIINVFPSDVDTSTKEKCRSGLSTPIPAGFYHQDIWKSFVCNTQHFYPPQMVECLKNKILHLIGDSTTRQWFEFFQHVLPGLEAVNLHTDVKVGPIMAVELKNNIIIHWRPHGYPLQFHKMPAADLHYLSNEIDDITGGPHVVVVFTFCAHLTFHPLTLYVSKVARIRQAVVDLLKRAPQTTIIIKSGNTGLLRETYSNDWYTMQENKVMKEMFSDIDGVIYMDVWQMTSCHYTPNNIHPAPVIVVNEIDMLLSYVCPS